MAPAEKKEKNVAGYTIRYKKPSKRKARSAKKRGFAQCPGRRPPDDISWIY